MRLAPQKLWASVHGPEHNRLTPLCVQNPRVLGPHRGWSSPPTNQQLGRIAGNATSQHSRIFCFRRNSQFVLLTLEGILKYYSPPSESNCFRVTRAVFCFYTFSCKIALGLLGTLWAPGPPHGNPTRVRTSRLWMGDGVASQSSCRRSWLVRRRWGWTHTLACWLPLPSVCPRWRAALPSSGQGFVWSLTCLQNYVESVFFRSFSQSLYF